MHHLLRRAGTGALLAALALTAVACGDDDEAPAETGEPPTTEAEETTTTSAPEEETTTTTAAGDEAATVEVTGVDYAYEGLPASVPAGTKLTFVNASDVEAHELVVGRLPDDETRSADEILADPEALETLFASVPPAAVLLAAPGEAGEAVPDFGDGTLTEPGRYLVVCTLPIGGDPAVVLDPSAEGPPASDAPPHFTEGMFAEVTVD